MMNIRKSLIAFVLFVLFCSAYGTQPDGAVGSDRADYQEDYYFLFRVGSSEFDLSFRNNRAQFDRMISSLGSMVSGPGVSVDRIVIRASSSPDGSFVLNERLWSDRANAVRWRILLHYPELAGSVSIQHKGEDWTGLYDAVLADFSLPNRVEAADIIAMSSTLESRKYFLHQLDGGRTWSYISKNILPKLRTASVAIFYTEIETEPIVVPPAVVGAPAGSVAAAPAVVGAPAESVAAAPAVVGAPAGSVAVSRPIRVLRDTVVVRDTIREFRSAPSAPIASGVGPGFVSKEFGSGMALKTNLLYLLGLQANMEAEFYFAGRWSLNLDVQVAWWSLPDRHLHYRYANFSPEARFWFRDDNSFTGNYIGLAIGGGLYDLSFGQASNNYEGYQGEFGTISLTYGHMWHVKNNFYIEAGLGVGYLFTEYRRYQNLNTHNVYQGTERLQTFIPTKLKVNLVWRLGNGNRKR